MHISTFLKRAAGKKFWQENETFFFHGADYPLRFFSSLIAQLIEMKVFERELRSSLPHQFTSSPLARTYLQSIKTQLNQSFLGNFQTYWLGNMSSVSKKERTALLTFLNAHRPGHSCFWFINTDDAEKFTDAVSVELPAIVDTQTLVGLNDFFSFVQHPKKIEFAQRVAPSIAGFGLDDACMLLSHLSCVSVKDLSQFEQNIPRLFESHLPLSVLSKSFFAKNVQDFYAAWVELEGKYPFMFWIAFWSEQMWRAYNVVYFLKHDNFIGAKRMSYRLPPDFMRFGWRNISLDELAIRHKFLYDADFAYKTGSTFNSLEVFFSNHFMGKF